MLTDTEKRAAKLAVSQYGVDRAKIDQAIQSVAEAQAHGERADFFQFLAVGRILTSSQIDELRQALDATQLDVNKPSVPRKSVADGDPSATELRVLGDYRILRRLGEGGMGAVYLGYHEAEGRYVAIKVLTEANQEAIDRFYREAKSGAMLNHPNIVRNLAVGQDQTTNLHYLVLEYVDGQSAQNLLDEFGRLQIGDAVHVVIDVGRALEHLHSRNIIHRDIKPGNILIARSGLAKLTDLGLAKRMDEASHLTATRQGFGTPYYMPYEQAMNAKKADARCDIYALGATLYHLVTGDVPFPGKTHLEIIDKKNIGDFVPASDVNPATPPVLDHIIGKMLARNPRDRYQTASELIVDLERSMLSAPVPSFIDYDMAMKDPHMRQRITAPAQPTCPDLRTNGNGDPLSKSIHLNSDVWYLRIPGVSGESTRIKTTVAQIYHGLNQGKLTAAVEASRQPNGVFLPLSRHEEFARVLEKMPLQKPTRKQRTAVEAGAYELDNPWVTSVLAVASVLLVVCVTVWLLFFT